MALPSTFVDSFLPMTPGEVLETIERLPAERSVSMLEIYNEVRPADLFCYLGARFGPPNGIQNFLRSDDSDNLVHWDWTLRYPDGVVMFLGTNFRTDVHIIGGAQTDGDRADLIEQLRSDFPKHGEGMRKIRAGLEQWTEFVNPFQRIKRSVGRLVASLDELNLRPREDRLDSFAFDTAGDTASRWTEVARRYSQGFGLCFGIRSMLPVMAEAFVNLLLYILMRPEIRTDDRLRDNAFRQPIDVRIKSLSINCVGFKRQPDYNDDVCRAYHRMVNERNDLLHGNVVLDKLKFNDVYFWGKVPVFREYKSVWERSLQIEADAVGLEALRSELATVEALSGYLLSCLDDALREKIAFLVGRHELGRNERTGTIGVLFPEWLVDFRLGPRASGPASAPDDSPA